MCGLVPVDSNSCFALGLRCFGSWLGIMSTEEPRSKGMMLAVLVEFKRVWMRRDANTLQTKLSSRNWATVCLSPWILFSAFRLSHSVFFLGFLVHLPDLCIASSAEADVGLLVSGFLNINKWPWDLGKNTEIIKH